MVVCELAVTLVFVGQYIVPKLIAIKKTIIISIPFDASVIMTVQ